MKNTPTPWELLLSDNATPHIMVRDGEKELTINDLKQLVCVMPAEITDSYNSYENAKFIVKAVNSHDELIIVLKEFVTDTQDRKEQGDLWKSEYALLERAEALLVKDENG